MSIDSSTSELSTLPVNDEGADEAAEERERLLPFMLQAALGSASTSLKQSGLSARMNLADKPALLSCASLTDFVSWVKVWKDYAKGQHLSSQDLETM